MDATEQAEHSARVAGIFDRSALTYDSVGIPFFTPIGEALVREIGPVRGARAVDIGCGRGAVLFPLAEAVGPSGFVTAIDLSARMVDATRKAGRDRGLTNIDVKVMDASSPQLDRAGYDLLVSSLVVFFLPDPLAGLRAWRDLLVPGGRLAISTFAARHTGWVAVDEALRPFLSPRVRHLLDDDPEDPFSSDAGVEAILKAAGFGQMRTTWFDAHAAFTDADQWYTWSWSHGQRVMWEAIQEADRDAARAAAAERLETCRESDGVIRLRQRVRFTITAQDLRRVAD